MNILQCFSFFCALAAAITISATPRDRSYEWGLAERRILNKILTDSGDVLDGIFTPSSISQHVTCGSSSLEIYGIYPSMGSELGGTPVAVAFRESTSETVSQSELDQTSFDTAALACKFGEYVQPVRRRLELDDEFERLAKAANVTGDVFLNLAYQILVCASPQFFVPGSFPGRLPFAISCSNEETATTQASIMTYSYSIAPSVHSVSPQLGGFGTEVTVRGDGFRNSSSLTCFFGEAAAHKTKFLSSNEIRCTAPDQENAEFPVAVSNNGIDLEGDWATTTFAYVPLPIIERIYPQTMTWVSNITVRIIGQNFASHPKVRPVCSFDGYLTSSAVVENPTVISCAVPSLQDLSVESPFVSYVRVSTNGGTDFSTLSLKVFFYHPVELFSYSLDVRSSVIVHGKNFHEAEELACLFQLDDGEFIRISATFYSMIQLRCQVLQLGLGRAQLWVSTSEEESGMSLNSLGFEFPDPLSLILINPTKGIIVGGTNIIVQGTGFYEGSSILCRFGASVVVATVLNSTVLSCVSPPATLALAGGSFEEWGSSYNEPLSTVVSFEISTSDGHSFTRSGTTFQYSNALARYEDMSWDVTEFASAGPHSEIKLLRLLPTGGSELGGTDVEVQGLNFVHGLACLFGSIESPLTEFLSSSRIVCKAPAAVSASMRSSVVNVTLTINSGEKIPHSLQFTYLPVSYITSFNPLFGTLDGGTSVHIHGADFDVIDGVQPTCLFSSSNTSTLAIVLSKTLVMCTITPANGASGTTVSMSFNGGYDVISADESFKYVSPAAITVVSPRFIPSNGDVKVTIQGDHFIPEGNLNGVCRCSFGDIVVTAIAITTNTIICFAPPMNPGLVDVRVSTNGIDFTTESVTVIYHLPPDILEVVPPFSLETGGEHILVRGSNFQPSPDLSCIFSTSRDNTQAVEAIFESDTEVTCIVPSIGIGTVTASLEISILDDDADGNPRIPFQYYQPISISSVKLDGGSINCLVLEVTGVHPSQDDLMCQVMRPGDDESIVFPRSKVYVISPFEIRCKVPPIVLEQYETEFSISLGVVYNEIFYQLTDPRLDPISLSQTNKLLGIGHSQTRPMLSDFLAVNEVSPTVFSDVGGSTINVEVNPHRVLDENLFCLFSNKGTNRTIQKSTASIVTRYHSFEDESLSDSSLVECTTPPMEPGQYSLSIGSSSMVTSTFLNPEVATITIIPAFSVIKFEPLSGSHGTEITVFGTGFPNRSLWCKIGEWISEASFLSNERLVCRVPPFDDSHTLPHPYLSISVSANGQDFSEMFGSQFLFIEPPYVSNMFPAEGTVMGGSLVTIQGRNLVVSNTDDILVSFGASFVRGNPLNETVITCITPPLETDIHAVPIRISTNGGHDFYDSALVYTYREVSVSYIFPSSGPAVGGNTVMVVGYGFTRSLAPDCRFGDIVVPAKYISDEKIECVAPKSAIDSIVIVMLVIDGVDLAALPATYRYIPMLRISEVIPFMLPTDAPHTVRVLGENFSQLPEFFCKLGTSFSGINAVVIDDGTLTCSLPPVQYPGEVALDLVTENGDSLLDIYLEGSLNFFDSSNFRISPSFGSIFGGTVLTATVGNASVVDFAGGDDLLCRFFTSNEPSSIIDVMAEPLTGNTFSCVSPNVTSFWKVDDQLHASVALVKRELGSPVGVPFPFTFKYLPVVKSISPILGRVYGGTLVRVVGDGTGIWLNSSLLTCYFGTEEGRAIWVSNLQVDCMSPRSFLNSSEVLLTISDNRADLSESQSTYLFHPDPVVTSVEPHFGLASMDNDITFLGYGFSRRDVPTCIFQEVDGNKNIHIEAAVLNETAMNCHAKSMSLDAAEYICMASNNKGVEYGRFGIQSAPVTYLSIDSPAVSSLAPHFGTTTENTFVTVTGSSLSVGEGRHFRTTCRLFDSAGSEVGSSLATIENATVITCVVRCPTGNVTTFYLGVTIGEFSDVYLPAMHIFWCYPKPAIVDLVPRFVSVGESTLIQIATRGILPSDCACYFGGNRVPGRHTHEGIECLTPEFDRPQSIEVSLEIGDTMVEDGLRIDVVDPISTYGIFPQAVHAGSNISIQGNNFIPEAIICTIGGKIGSVVLASESEVVCRSSPELEITLRADAEVRLVLDNAPQISAFAGTVEVYPAPRISRVTPSSGLAIGGTNVIVRGANFHVLGDPLCFFDGVPVGANIISENTIACVTPASSVGTVQVQVSLDSGRSLHGTLPFYFFKPIILRDIYPRVVINGSKLHALGEGFNFDLPMQCAIGDNSFSEVTVLSATEATCTYANAEHSYGRLVVSLVTLNNVTASVALSADLSVVSQPLVEISALSHLYGSAIGGESILLHVSGIVHDYTQEKFGPIHCNFAGKVALAIVLDENSLSCTVPPSRSPGKLSLSLLYTGVPFSSNSLVFEYTADAKVYAISPRGGAYSGGTIVRVSGINLVSRSRVLCRFGRIESYGYLDASANSAIYCLTPSVNHVSSETIYLQLGAMNGWLDTGVDFNFFEPIAIESISPLEIGTGTDSVRVNGIGFSNLFEVLCCFGEEGNCILRKAIILSKTALDCPFPWDAIDKLDPIPIAITANGIDFVRSMWNVTYNKIGIVLKSISPNFGPSYGGTEVEIFGVGFKETATCWFGDVGTRATYVAHDRVKCLTSSALVKENKVIEEARVTVTSGNVLAPNYSDSSLSFVFFPEQSSFSMHPIHGVSSGGTEVRLSHPTLGAVIGKLEYFGVQVRPVCQFVARIETYGLVCISPPTETRGNATEAVRVSVALNGKDFVFAKDEFSYFTPPTIRSIAPESIWIDTPLNVSIFGSHFLPLDQARCHVGGEKIPAEVISSSEIVCLINLTKSFPYQSIVPIAVSLNSVDVSNFIPLICRVIIPTVTAASMLFGPDTGGSVVNLTGYGFEQVSGDGNVKLSGNNYITNLVVRDDESASFIVPPSSGQKTATIYISFGSDDSFIDTGFELIFLPQLNVSILEQYLMHTKQTTRISIAGEFDTSLSYTCVIHEDISKNSTYEVMAAHLNETVIRCDFIAKSRNGTMGISIRRDDNYQTSNVLAIFASHEFLIYLIDPNVVSEAEAVAGGILFSIWSSREFPFDKGDTLYCVFLDAAGTSSMAKAEAISASEIRCAAHLLRGDAEVYLTRDGTPQSNFMPISVRPTSQVFTLEPYSASTSGGARLQVKGVGFSAYFETVVHCQIGNETSVANIADDETIFCVIPSTRFDGIVIFTLIQARRQGIAAISTSEVTFEYYSPTNLVVCVPGSGPASGGALVQLHHGGLICGFECDYLISFTSVADSTRVAYSNTVLVISSSILEVVTPPSPIGSSGGTVFIQVSRNGGHEFSAGVYYHYTESAFIESFHPRQVIENSCFRLTFHTENIPFSQLSCFIGIQMYAAHQDLSIGTGTVSCSVCDLEIGYYQVGLLTGYNDSILASEELSVERYVDLLKLTPSEGPVGGGTVVLVEGSQDFSVWECQLYCYFGHRSAAASILNSTLLQCITPAGNSSKEPLHIAPYHQPMAHDSDSFLHFQYYVEENVISIQPRSGPKTGGTVVKIFGSGFLNRTTLSCKFGDLIIDATFVNDERIDCSSPPERHATSQGPLPKSTPLMVSNNKHDFVPAGSFVYHDIPGISAIVPSMGPAFTKVTLYMESSLNWVENPVCRFGDELANATAMSDIAFVCISPLQLVSINNQVKLEFSLNGHDFFGNEITFKYSGHPLIYSIFPSVGPMSGNTSVVVSGQNLHFSGDLICKFGNVETMALWKSVTAIVCTAPPQTVGTVSFGVTSKISNINIEHLYDDTLLRYTYLSPITITSIRPTHGSIRGGTLVSIDVDSFTYVERVFCVFDGKSTSIAKVTFTSNASAVMKCMTPQRTTTGIVPVGLAQDDLSEPTLLSLFDAEFRYVNEPLLAAVYPGRGPATGGTMVTLMGKNFFSNDMDTVFCKFDSLLSPAVFVSDEEVICISPGHSPVREIQAVTITSNASTIRGSVVLGFNNSLTDLISIDSSAETIRRKISQLPGMEDVSVGVRSSPDSLWMFTFHGFARENQPHITVKAIGLSGEVHVERFQSLCCEVTLSLNGLDYYGGEKQLMFVYDEKIAVIDVSPSHGTVSGGTPVNLTVTGISQNSVAGQPNDHLMCVFGGDDAVGGYWIHEDVITCYTPASYWEAKVAVSIRIGTIRAESAATFTFHKDPLVLSVFPSCLPALGMSTSSIRINASFYSSVMTCIFDVSITSVDSSGRQKSTHRQPAIIQNSSHIDCPDPPSLKSFFSDTDLNWTTNATLIRGSLLNISLESGADLYAIGAIPYHAVVKIISLHPQSGPRSGGTEVIVDGQNFINLTSTMSCRFGSVSSKAHYISPEKIICIAPHFPLGYGRVVVPVQVSLNGADFSDVSENSMFEFHETLVVKHATPLVGLPKGGTVVNITLDDDAMRYRAVRDRVTSLILISHLDPSYGPDTGGNVVIVHCRNTCFTPDHFTACHFGNKTTPARYRSEMTIECLAPKATEGIMEVDVIISVDEISSLVQQRYQYLPIQHTFSK